MLTLFCRRRARSRLRRRGGERTPSGTARSSGTCSSAGSTCAPSQFEACSSRSRTATRRSTDDRGRRRVLRDAVPALWDDDRRERRGREPLWADGAAPADGREPSAVFSPLVRRALRARPRDDLRGLPRPLRSPAAVRAARRRHRPPARRLPARARARPDRGDGSMPAVADLGGADLALRAAARRRAPGDGAAWAATAARLGHGGLDDARRALRERRDPGPLDRLARAAAGSAAVDDALAAHALRLRQHRRRWSQRPGCWRMPPKRGGASFSRCSS